MFRLLAVAMLLLQSVAIPFANGREGSVCHGEKAAQTTGHSCCGSECHSGCCSPQAPSRADSTPRTCCSSHSRSPAGPSNHAGCGGTCSGCPCCFALPMAVAAVTAGDAIRPVLQTETVTLLNDLANGLVREPTVPPPIAA